MVLPTHFELNTGAKIPSVGLGTWQSKPGEVADAVTYAIKEAGYRHIDGAYCYGNEKEVGEGIKKSGVPRSEIFITSKLWGTYHTRPEEGLDKTLADLGTDYLDLFLIHWPIALNPNGNDDKFPKHPDGSRDILHSRTIEETWKDFEKLLDTGKVRAIGISNASVKILERVLKVAKVVPTTNQVELHPYLPQHDLVSYCKSKGILPQAYSPLGSTGSPLLSDPEITAIADAHKASVGNVLISYQVARGVNVLPKSVTPSRIKENIGLVDLTPEDVKKLDSLAAAGKAKRFIKPDWRPFDLGFDDWTYE